MYGPLGVVPSTPQNFEKIYDSFIRGMRYIIIEHHEKFPGIVNDSIVSYIEENLAPAFIVEDPAVTFFPIKAECEYYSPEDYGLGHVPEIYSRWNSFVTKPSPEDKLIRVFDLNQFFSDDGLLSNHPSPLFYFASQKFKEQKYGEALPMFQKLISINDSPIYRIHVGVCHLKLGRKELAKKIFMKLANDDTLIKEIRDMNEYFIKQCD